LATLVSGKRMLGRTCWWRI